MKFSHIIGFTSVFCVLLASCYPVNESPGRKPQGPQTGQPQPLTPEQQKAKAAEELKKKEEAKKQAELKKQEELKNGGTGSTAGGDTTNPEKTPPPSPPKDKADYQYANKVPGKEGFVFSPYNNKVIDVRDIPSGQLVQDPTYPPAEKKYFRVP
jgi:hypothetical protein